MKWTNQERLHAYGVRLVGWPADIPLHNPSILKATQNAALLDALRKGWIRFERLNAPPSEDLGTRTEEDTVDEDISWACNDAGEAESFCFEVYITIRTRRRKPWEEREILPLRLAFEQSARWMVDDSASRRASSPISAIPPETLIEIFDACRVRNHYDDRDLNALTVRAGPPTVTAVCADWRRLAIASPSLWTDVHFNIYSPALLLGAATLLETFLSRSMNLPLHVCIALRRGIVWEEQEVLPLRLLVKQSMRWASLQACVDIFLCRSLLPISGRLPILQTVRFNMLTGCDDVEWAPFRGLFSDCPMLINFDGESGPSFSLPWEQLQRLYLRLSFPIEAAERATRVRALSLTWYSLDSHTPDTKDILHRPHLQKASLEFHLLRRIRAPLLSECHIRDIVGHHAKRPQRIQDIANYIRANCNSLTALSLRLSPVDPEALEALLMECPALRRLQVEICANYEVSDEDDARVHTRMTKALTVCAGEVPLIPALVDLRVIMRSVRSAASVSGFEQVLQSRASAYNGASALQSFTLKIQGVHPDPRVPDVLAQLTRVNFEGCTTGGGAKIDIERGVPHWKLESAWQRWIEV
ncbi:uncharacterized protein SCHCODRAFT_02578219 [Schizophyllum commune H4-8]|uniref:Uncharacterized protein n=1 Tax=Schizophyllum commune (strain H4-8 / FGSC 9210) TaxID=578458 RepID=D8Q5D9_SCHCM|nr:uncharacterized protein SCHCODRAFT_02578219 [Schizophyllum commune H4-8]KAI5892217.1 hypothetical protein SCHCODRAFT_02578219 [Schizophyllum commune H4-8]